MDIILIFLISVFKDTGINYLFEILFSIKLKRTQF